MFSLMNQAINVLIIIYATLFISSPLIAILHELGHAFAYLALTKPDGIDIYIGSYGTKKNAIKFTSGKLTFYIKRSFPFVKGIGLCHSNKADTNYKNYIIILIAGAVFTFFVACIPCLVMLLTPTSIYVQIACYVFLGISAVSLITNLVPREIDKTYGVNIDNDGKQLAFILKIKGKLPDYVKAIEHIHAGEFEQGIEKFKNVLEVAPMSEKVLRLIITTSLAAKKYEVAELYIGRLETGHELTSDDLLHKGYIQSLTHRHDEAIDSYSKALKKNRHNVVALNNIADELIEKQAYTVAQQALDKAIHLKPGFDYPYSTLARLKIIQGDLEAGKQLISQCLDINKENPDAYKVLGIYYLKLKDTAKANENFSKARELDSDIDLGIYAEELKQLEEQDLT
jgi:hypothetical protein